jgi:hypothetical protein
LHAAPLAMATRATVAQRWCRPKERAFWICTTICTQCRNPRNLGFGTLYAFFADQVLTCANDAQTCYFCVLKSVG